MPIISIVLVLLVVGFGLYIAKGLSLDPTIKTVITFVVLFAVLIWLLNLLGFHTGFNVRLR